MNFSKGISLLAMTLVFFIASSFAPSNKGAEIPFEIHKFAFEELEEGNPVLMDYICGKTLFVNFWATYCHGCVQEMPSIAKAQERLSTTDYEFYIVSCESPWDIIDFEQAYCYPMTHLYAPNGREYGVRFLPQTFIIRDGDILASYSGVRDWASPENLDLLRSYSVYESDALMACE